VGVRPSDPGATPETGIDGNTDKAARVLGDLECVRSAETREDGTLRLAVEVGETAMPRIMRALADVGIELATIELHRPTLDDVFLARTGRSLRES
jgi:ABC-2 type transport system ATP-binding protein